MKYRTEIGWLFVAPAALIISLVGLVPLITVVNYSFFEIFILNARFLGWYGMVRRNYRVGALLGQLWPQHVVFRIRPHHPDPPRHRNCALHSKTQNLGRHHTRARCFALAGSLEHDPIAMAQFVEFRDRNIGSHIAKSGLGVGLETLDAAHLGGDHCDGCLALDQPCCDPLLQRFNNSSSSLLSSCGN